MPKTPLCNALTMLAFTAAMLSVSSCHAPTNPAPPAYSESSTIASAPRPYDRSDRRYDRHDDRRESRSYNAHQASDTPGAFDFYLLTLSWSPEFCSTHPGAPECAAHLAFVLHGLWPQNNDGSYPERCSDAPGPANPAQYSDIFPDSGLLAHEWQTHGTCSGLAPDAYFALARRAYRALRVPSQLASLHDPIQLTPGAILKSFAQSNAAIPVGDMALGCGSNFLTAVEVCLDKNLQATSCSHVRTCHANVVKITPPGTGPN